MAEKMSEVYEMYDVQADHIGRGRGAMLLHTDKGIRQVRAVTVSESRLAAEYEFKERLFESGYQYIDRVVKNVDGELATYDRYGNPFAMRMYFEGHEMNVGNKQEIMLAVDNLVMLHRAGREAWRKTESDMQLREKNDVRRRNRELKRVHNYIAKQSPKREFETLYMKAFPYFYAQGLACEVHDRGQSGRQCMAENSVQNGQADRYIGYCHGSYNYHSVLICSDAGGSYAATINFDRFHVGNQLQDLYYFIRKTVEKSDYSFELLTAILRQYHQGCPLTKEDVEYIYRLYRYPEKFYKLSNQYMNGPKNRISPKTIEKLNRIIEEEEKKQALLEKMNIFASHLQNNLV